MERTSAACAMEWSIDLEKGLRSKKPGQSLEAILRIGPRLEQWDREPAINIAQCNMFGLIPGEDRLFANAILLCLANAFCSGDKQTKICIVKVFLSLLRKRKKRSRQHTGIMFKCSLENRLQLLKQVKNAYDTGDVESRALALVLFGCWADVARDNADIRYLVLSSLVSFDNLMVEGSLFAGGCFCELSNDFASILLEILVNLLTSSETSSTARFAAVRAFAKVGCSTSHASKAYEAGLKMVLGSSDEDFLVAMLISLSKLASRLVCLISRQVDLLLSFLVQGKPFHLQATALKCLHYITARGICHVPTSAVLIRTLVSMLHESEFPAALQCGALKFLHKVLLCNVSTMHCVDMPELSDLLSVLENATQSPILAKRLLAIRVLVETLGKLVGIKGMALDGFDSTTLVSRMISLVIDETSLLSKLVLDLPKLDSDMERRGKSLLSLLLVVEKYPDLGGMVLDKICLLLENLMNKHDQVMGTLELNLPGHEIVNFRGQNIKLFTSKLFLYASKVVAACLKSLDEANAITAQVLNTVELLVRHVQQCSFIDCFTRVVYSFLLHSHINCSCMFKEIVKIENLDKNLPISLQDYLVQHEILTLECAKNMLATKDNWPAYKFGKYAACQGAWFTAVFIFEHLATIVQSNTCCRWLKSLVEFSQSERKIQLLYLPEQGFSLVNWLETNKTTVTSFRDDFGERFRAMNWKLSVPNNIENLIEACDSLRSSEETMEVIMISGHPLCFQRWFLALRVKVLESIADILRLYCVPFTHDDFNNDAHVKGSIVVECPRFVQWITSLACSVTQISLRLNKLAREFDLIAASFKGMDKKSLEIISANALSCSLLAFSTGFSLFFSSLHMEKVLGMPEECLHGMLIQDLVWRLQKIDCETSAKIVLLWKVCRRPRNSFLLSRNQILNVSCDAKSILTVCGYAVTRVVALQNVVNKVHDNEILCQVTKDGLELLLDIISKWMLVPFRTPSYFFRVRYPIYEDTRIFELASNCRHCISSELFAMKSDTRSPDEISILPGFHLSLSLCLQLKNVPLDPPVNLNKMYCILYCRTSFQVPYPGADMGQMQLGCQDWGADDMVYLDDKLFQFVTGSTKKASNRQHIGSAGGGEVVEICVCFEPSERGQGFSTCLLDVSAFPVGSYRIKWRSCFVDNKGSYWSPLPLNAGPVFTVQKNLSKD